MKKYFRKIEKARKADEKAKNSYTTQHDVIEYWLDRIQSLETRKFFHNPDIVWKDTIDEQMGNEIWYHFDAYRKAFRKLGYKLKKNNGEYRFCDWYIKF